MTMTCAMQWSEREFERNFREYRGSIEQMFELPLTPSFG